MTNSEHLSELRLSQFDYELPSELIAQTPLEKRDASRLMVVDRHSGLITHQTIRDLPSWLNPGDLLVVNNTRVIPARIYAFKKASGGKVELLLLHRDPSGVWTCLAKPSKSLRTGVVLHIAANVGEDSVEAEVVDNRGEGEVAIRFTESGQIDLDLIGVVPLPPYIRAPLETAERYQTTYARVTGSAAAPTAGLHITDVLRRDLLANGVGWAEVTLHIGLDTFRPVTVESMAEHRIHREWCSIPSETAVAVHETRAAGGRVIAVGTTSSRSLEMWANQTPGGSLEGFEGWADIFITPGYRWKIVDAMLTNFHLPKSTLLMMISSFAGADRVREAYRIAIEDRYRFFSFGDAMLLL